CCTSRTSSSVETSLRCCRYNGRPRNLDKKKGCLGYLKKRNLTQISSCQSKQMAAYLQTLKETFADPGEALKLRWIDVNASNNTITINRPVKGHNPRQLKVSNKLIAMLNTLPKDSELVFPRGYRELEHFSRTEE
ncbi:hypothetical protein MUP01_12260, partial [Candidatus Bathyarchaeota archaeon]|nr:hypothetical protein [Candidatus Bathyarchaeota archaeon]